MKNKAIRRFEKAVLVLALSALGSGCGKDTVSVTRADAVPHREPQHQISPLTTGEFYNFGFYDPQTLTKLMGTYTGTIQGWASNGDAFSQPYSLVLSTTQVNGQYGTMTTVTASFQSGGGADSIPISVQSAVTPGLSGQPANGVLYYSFVSTKLDIPSISQFPVALELVLALGGSGLTLVPRQSAIYFKDCTFSQGVECSNDVQNVWFLDDLGRRN